MRQLQNVLQQAIVKATGPVLIADFLPSELRDDAAARMNERGESPPSDLAPFVERQLRDGSSNLYSETTTFMDRYLLIQVMRATGGNQSKAAKILGLARGSLRGKIRELGISITSEVDAQQSADDDAELSPIGDVGTG